MTRLTRAQRRALVIANAEGEVTRDSCRSATLLALEARRLLSMHYHHDYKWTITNAGRAALAQWVAS